jgi:hypothetical protein
MRKRSSGSVKTKLLFSTEMTPSNQVQEHAIEGIHVSFIGKAEAVQFIEALGTRSEVRMFRMAH